MNENVVNNNFFKKITEFFKTNIKSISIILFLFLLAFISFQIYVFYSSSKIKKNSISFFQLQNIEDINLKKNTILELSNNKDIYGVLSKLQLIEINLNQQNYQDAINLYDDLLNDSNLEIIYKSAIAAQASYNFLDLNFDDLSMNYLDIINNYILLIDDKLNNFKSVKLELKYLSEILFGEINKVKYQNNKEALNIHKNLMNSDVGSSTKERINKIHEFFFYK